MELTAVPDRNDTTASREYAPAHGRLTEARSGQSKFSLKRGPGYVYEEMADHIAGRIEHGDLVADEALPSERDLAAQYAVSLGTARHATRLLRDRGLVRTVRSKGNYITPREEWSRLG